MIDQVIAQWHSNICGLGEIFDRLQVKKALQSIYKYNFKSSVRKYVNPCRLYALDDEAGTVICEWPQEKYKPIVPVPYAEETWSGCEYQFASHLVQEGFYNESVKVVKAVRDRYNGEKRNPWNEFECGSNYARSMASYALLLSCSGFMFDMKEGLIGFNPVKIRNRIFKCFWSQDTGWGTFETRDGCVELKVLYGNLKVKVLKLPFLTGKKVKSIHCAGKEAAFTISKGCITLDNEYTIKEKNSLAVKV